jgi:hypothetical protein
VEEKHEKIQVQKPLGIEELHHEDTQRQIPLALKGAPYEQVQDQKQAASKEVSYKQIQGQEHPVHKVPNEQVLGQEPTALEKVPPEKSQGQKPTSQENTNEQILIQELPSLEKGPPGQITDQELLSAVEAKHEHEQIQVQEPSGIEEPHYEETQRQMPLALKIALYEQVEDQEQSARKEVPYKQIQGQEQSVHEEAPNEQVQSQESTALEELPPEQNQGKKTGLEEASNEHVPSIDHVIQALSVFARQMLSGMPEVYDSTSMTKQQTEQYVVQQSIQQAVNIENIHAGNIFPDNEDISELDKHLHGNTSCTIITEEQEVPNITDSLQVSIDISELEHANRLVKFVEEEIGNYQQKRKEMEPPVDTACKRVKKNVAGNSSEGGAECKQKENNRPSK